MRRPGFGSRLARALPFAAIALSLALNVAALVVPFLSVDVAFKGTSLYSLPRSVKLLWQAGLHVLAVLVALFSILFPFVKLAVLTWVATGLGSERARERWIARVGNLGRWSMLDVFLASLLLGITNDRFFVDTQALIGLPLFALAIAISLTTGELLERRSMQRETYRVTPATHGQRALLLLTWLVLLAAVGLPFLQISDWRMRDDTYSLAGLVGSLWGASGVVAALLAVFVIGVPLLELGAISVAALAPSRVASRAARVRRYLERWSMLEVFVAALAIFMAEGHEFVRTELRWGTLLLLGALLLHVLGRRALERRLRRMPRRKAVKEPPAVDPARPA
jgi:paraquat-inducible protein A